jgi:tRNA uridine 5-carboxymethylaminomethyl modification enzyme
VGLLPGAALAELRARQDFIAKVEDLCRRHSVFLKDRGKRLMVADYFRFPGVNWQSLRNEAQAEDEFWSQIDFAAKELFDCLGDERLVERALFQVETDTRYDGYIAKQNRLIHNQEHLDNLDLPADLDFMALTALSYEAREKLQRIRPQNLGQAGRIDGVRAGDLAVLVVYLKKLKEQQNGAGADD